MSAMLDPISPADHSVGHLAASSKYTPSAHLDDSPPKRRILRIRGIGNVSYPSALPNSSLKSCDSSALPKSPAKLPVASASPQKRLRILGTVSSRVSAYEDAESKAEEIARDEQAEPKAEQVARVGRKGHIPVTEPKAEKAARLGRKGQTAVKPEFSDPSDDCSHSDCWHTPSDLEENASDYYESSGLSSEGEASWGAPRSRLRRQSFQRMRSTGSSILDDFLWRRPKQVHSKKISSQRKRKEKARRHTEAVPEAEDIQESSDDLSGEEDVDKDIDFDGELSDASAGEEDGRIDESPYSKAWQAVGTELKQGEVGFNSYVMEKARLCGLVGKEPEKPKDGVEECPPLQFHQEMIVFLLRPSSPVARLLVDQPTGSGKTREMIAALDGFFHDKRPKVPVFPRAAVCWNFYEELLRWPSKYRDFFCCLHPKWAAMLSDSGDDEDWIAKRLERWPLSGLSSAELRAATTDLRVILEMKHTLVQGRFVRGFRAAFRSTHPNVPLPGAPLRALTFASAGGSHSMLAEDGQPVSALLKVGYPGDGCVYSRKIVFLDEAHNLIRTQTKYGRQLNRLRQLLFEAEGSVIVGFTGTPIGDEPASGRELLNTFKGKRGAGLSDEGFIASLTQKTPPLFPRMSPVGVPDVALNHFVRAHLCRQITLRSETLKAYDMKLAGGTDLKRLRGYCNIGSFCSTFHGSRRMQMLRRPHQWMPKLLGIASAICRRREKAVVLISRQGGYKAMLALLSNLAESAKPPFCVTDGDSLLDFNKPSNSHGQEFLVLVADSAQFGEGTSFFSVRRLYLADVPMSASAFQQQVGRVSRMFGHHQLPAAERSVSIVLPIACAPASLRDLLFAWAFRALCGKASDIEEVMSCAKDIAQKLRQAGIEDLHALKQRVDHFGGHQSSVSELFRAWGIRDTDNIIHKKLGSTPKNRKLLQGRLLQEPARGIMRQLVKAAEQLYRASSADDIISRLCTKTADEIAIEELSKQLAAQIPELHALRQGAISCDAAKGTFDIAEAVEDNLGECVSDWESTLTCAQEYSLRGPRFVVDTSEPGGGLFGPWSARGDQIGEGLLVGHPVLKCASAGSEQGILEPPTPAIVRAPLGNLNVVNGRPQSLLKRTSLVAGQQPSRKQENLVNDLPTASSWESLTRDVVDRRD